MTMKNRSVPLLILLSLAFIFTSCSGRNAQAPLSSGVPITPDAIDSLYAQFTATDKESLEEPTDTEFPYGLDGDLTVYWYGELPTYHTNTECVLLRTAENAESSSLAEALENGRTDVCHECADLDNLN